MLQLVATCGLGLEEILAAELRQLVSGRIDVDRGAVRFTGSWEDCWRANWRLRSANRVLVELASWTPSRADLRKLARQGRPPPRASYTS